MNTVLLHSELIVEKSAEMLPFLFFFDEGHLQRAQEELRSPVKQSGAGAGLVPTAVAPLSPSPTCSWCKSWWAHQDLLKKFDKLWNIGVPETLTKVSVSMIWCWLWLSAKNRICVPSSEYLLECYCGHMQDCLILLHGSPTLAIVPSFLISDSLPPLVPPLRWHIALSLIAGCCGALQYTEIMFSFDSFIRTSFSFINSLGSSRFCGCCLKEVMFYTICKA